MTWAWTCVRLFICALWSPAGKVLASWLSFVVSICVLIHIWTKGEVGAVKPVQAL